jgi:hypothetical protein
MIDRLRELLRAATPGPWASEATEHLPPNALVYGPDGDSFAYLTWNPGNDDDPVATAAYIAACDPCTVAELLDAHDRMAGALAELIRTTDAYGEAQASRGHEGTPHDLYFHSAFSHVGDPATCLTVDDCSACMSAMYGTEAEMQMSLDAARAALAVPKEENPDA